MVCWHSKIYYITYYYYKYSFESFSRQSSHLVFHNNFSDSKSLQVTRTRLNILAELNIAVVWMVSTGLLISKSFSPFTQPLQIVSNAPLILVLPSHSRFIICFLFCFGVFFFVFLFFSSEVCVLISLFSFFYFYSEVCRDDEFHYSVGSLYYYYHYYYFTRCEVFTLLQTSGFSLELRGSKTLLVSRSFQSILAVAVGMVLILPLNSQFP